MESSTKSVVIYVLTVYLFSQTSLLPPIDSQNCFNQWRTHIALIYLVKIVLVISLVCHSLCYGRSGGATRVAVNVKRLTWIHTPTTTQAHHGKGLVKFYGGVTFTNRLRRWRIPMFKVCMYMYIYWYMYVTGAFKYCISPKIRHKIITLFEPHLIFRGKSFKLRAYCIPICSIIQ